MKYPDKVYHDVMVEMGRKGGRARSERKTEAVRRNAKKGGWPKGKARKPKA